MNIYALLPLLGLVLTLALAAFVLRPPRKKINIIFLLMLLCAFLWMLGEFMRRLYLASPSPLIWSYLETAGIIFIAPLFFRFVALLYVSTNPPLLNNVRFWAALFGVGFIFLFLLLTGHLIGETSLYYWGYDYELKPAYAFLYLYVIGVMVASVVQLFRVFRLIELQVFRRNLKYTLLGCTTALVILALGDIVPVVFGFDFPSLAAAGLIAIELSIGKAIIQRRFIAIPAVSRFFVPLPEVALSSKRKYRLAKGRSYLVEGAKHDDSFGIFLDQIAHGIPGFWITALRPKDVEKHDLLRTPIIFISEHRISGEIVMPPKELERLKEFVENRLELVSSRSVVLLDCFYQLMVANGFRKALDFVAELGKICSRHSSNLIVQLNPRRFTGRQLKLVEEALGAVRQQWPSGQ